MNDPLSGLGYVLASARVAKERARVRFLYRERPDDDRDSGWRIFAGDEDQAYADDPANLGIHDAATIAAIDPDIVPLLATPYPCAFERADARSPFQRSAFGFEPRKE